MRLNPAGYPRRRRRRRSWVKTRDSPAKTLVKASLTGRTGGSHQSRPGLSRGRAGRLQARTALATW